jgi:hypothetical protein
MARRTKIKDMSNDCKSSEKNPSGASVPYSLRALEELMRFVHQRFYAVAQ